MTSSESGLSSGPQYIVSIETEKPLFVANQTVVINGTISPALASPSNLTIVVINPDSVIMANDTLALGTAAATFSYSLVPSGLGCGWITGTYNVTAGLTGSRHAGTTFIYNHAHPGANGSSSVTSTTTCTKA